jgi:uncharacterized protein
MSIVPNRPMLKIVLDTNVIVSGFNFQKSNPAKILLLLAAGEIINLISAPILEETRRILAEKFFWTRREVAAAEVWLRTFSTLVNPKGNIAAIADEPDNRILECATAGRADFIISGDHHLTDLKNYQGIKIVGPAAFLGLMVKFSKYPDRSDPITEE